MKKLNLTTAAILGSMAFTACKKENVQPAASVKVSTLSDKSNLSQADDIAPTDPATGDKSNLSQADFTAATTTAPTTTAPTTTEKVKKDKSGK
jgi:hypothetical protein